MILFFAKALFWSLVLAFIILFILWDNDDVVENVPLLPPLPLPVLVPWTWKGKKRITTKGKVVEVSA